MFGLDDLIRTRPLATAGLAALAIIAVRPPWARRNGRAKDGAGAEGGVKAVVKLCLEARADAEADIVGGLCEVAIDDVVCALDHPEPEARHEAARAAVHKYAKRAHRRSARQARDESDRQRRYARHMAALSTRLSEHHAAAPEAHRSTFEHALSALHGVRSSPPEPGPDLAARTGTTGRPVMPHIQ